MSAPYTLYLNGLTVNGRKLGGLLAPTENDQATTKIYVDSAVASAITHATTAVNNVLDSAPDALNTLKELSTALGNDADFASSITTLIGNNKTNIQNSLTAEVTRAQTAESTLTTNLSTLTSNLAAEVSRAQTAEGTLTTNLSTLTSNLTAEVSRAQTAEAALTALINSASSNSVSGLAALTSYIHELHRAFFDNGVKPSNPPGYTTTTTTTTTTTGGTTGGVVADGPPAWIIPDLSVFQSRVLAAPSFAAPGATIVYSIVAPDTGVFTLSSDGEIVGAAVGSGQVRASWTVSGTAVSATGTVNVV